MINDTRSRDKTLGGLVTHHEVEDVEARGGAYHGRMGEVRTKMGGPSEWISGSEVARLCDKRYTEPTRQLLAVDEEG